MPWPFCPTGRYCIKVNTGYRYNAGLPHETRVYIQLFGTRGDTREFELGHEWRPLFQRGATDVFLVTAPHSVGHVTAVRIRHDGNGVHDNPSWYLSNIEVTDLSGLRQAPRFFFLEKWVALGVAECQLEYDISGLTLKETSTFKRCLTARLTAAATDNHTILSAFLCPPAARFNRAQRTMTLMAFLCGSIFANAFFFRTDGDELNVLQMVTTGIFSSLIVMIPISVLIFLFRRARPAKSAGKSSGGGSGGGKVAPAEQGSEGSSTAKAPSAGSGGGAAKAKAGEADALAGNSVTKDGTLVAVAAGSEEDADADTDADTDTDVDFMGSTKQLALPAFCRPLAWLMALAICLWSCYYVLLLSFQWGPRMSWVWLGAVFSSVFMLTAITDPLFMLLVALAGTVLFGYKGSMAGQVDGTSDKEIVLTTVKNVERLRAYRAKSSAKATTRLPASYLDKMAALARRNTQMEAIIWSIVRYIVFYACVLTSFYTSTEDNAFGLIGFVVDTVAVGEGDMIWKGNSIHDYETEFGDIGNQEDFWDWADESLGSMYTRQWYNGNEVGLEAQAFDASKTARLTKDQVYLFGAPRLRQLRVRRDAACTVAKEFEDMVEHCLGAWSRDSNDEAHFLGHSYEGGPNTTSTRAGWSYGLEGSTPFWGEYLHTLYDRPGYTQALPASSAAAARQTVQDMRAVRWLDNATRFATLELTVYSPVTDRVVAAGFFVEFTATGGVTPSVRLTSMPIHRYRSEDAWLTILCELLLLVLCTRMLSALASTLWGLVKKHGVAAGLREYATAVRVYDSVLCTCVMVGFGLHLTRMAFLTRVSDKYRDHGSAGVYFDDFMAFEDLEMSYNVVCGLIVLLATLKFVVLFRHNTKVKQVVLLYYMAAVHASGLLFNLLIIFAAYSLCGHLAFGAALEEFSTVHLSAATLFSAKLGEFDTESWQQSQNMLVPIFFITFMMLMVFYLLNMFVAMLNMTFGVVTDKHESSELDLYLYLVHRVRYLVGLPVAREKPTLDTDVADQLTDLDNKVAAVVKQFRAAGERADKNLKRARRASRTLPEAAKALATDPVLKREVSVMSMFRRFKVDVDDDAPHAPPRAGKTRRQPEKALDPAFWQEFEQTMDKVMQETAATTKGSAFAPSAARNSQVHKRIPAATFRPIDEAMLAKAVMPRPPVAPAVLPTVRGPASASPAGADEPRNEAGAQAGSVPALPRPGAAGGGADSDSVDRDSNDRDSDSVASLQAGDSPPPAPSRRDSVENRRKALKAQLKWSAVRQQQLSPRERLRQTLSLAQTQNQAKLKAASNETAN